MFQYTPLKPDSNSFRVLTIEPREASDGVSDDLLRCTLKEIDLDDWTQPYQAWVSLYKFMIQAGGWPDTNKTCLAGWHYMSALERSTSDEAATIVPLVQQFVARLRDNNDAPFEGVEVVNPRFHWGDFIALSYVWGDAGNRCDISLNGCLFSITSNLYQALLQLRDSFEVRRMNLYIWIDAICINQDDLDERAAQVRKMDIVYSQCLAVRAYLGQADPKVSRELHLLRPLLETLGRSHPSDVRWDMVVDMGLEESLWKGMSIIISLPYWQRLWTIQEMAVAPSVLYCYGHHTFTTKELDLCCLIVYHGAITQGIKNFVTWDDNGMSNDNFSIYTHLMKFQTRLAVLRPPDMYKSQAQNFKLVNLMHLARQSEATDLRDKVYGVLALLPQEVAVQIYPSYQPSTSFLDVFVTFSKSCFRAAGNLDILNEVRRSLSPVNGLPSWALNLTETVDDAYNLLFRKPLREYNANLEIPETGITFSKDSSLLYCDGVMVDAISLLGSAESKLRVPVQSRSEIIQEVPDLTRFTHEEWKRSIARVFLQDSSFEFSGSPSILDIPWLESDELDDSAPYGFGLDPFRHSYFDEIDTRWSRFYGISQIKPFFSRFLYGNEAISVGGRPLRSYFSSIDKSCPDPGRFEKLVRELTALVTYNRLCISRNGLIGMVPELTQLGDRIVVLSKCNTPIVLRPNGDAYEVIGPCFVEGLMKGEVAAGIERGQFYLERICLC